MLVTKLGSNERDGAATIFYSFQNLFRIVLIIAQERVNSQSISLSNVSKHDQHCDSLICGSYKLAHLASINIDQSQKPLRLSVQCLF